MAPHSRRFRPRYFESRLVDPRSRGVKDLDGAITKSSWNLTGDEMESLKARLADVLATGNFHYVVAAQRFTPTMQVTLEYLNTTMRHGRFYLVEVIQLEGSELVAHAAQVVAGPARRSASGQLSAAGQADEATFLNGLEDPEYREAMHDLLAGCAPLGLSVEWGSRGASIRVATPDRREPLSVAWVLPPNSHWSGARHATFGVDRGTLAQTPTVADAVRRYVASIREIRGATAVPSKHLNAFTFAPDSFPAAHTRVLEALAGLVNDVSGASEG